MLLTPQVQFGKCASAPSCMDGNGQTCYVEVLSHELPAVSATAVLLSAAQVLHEGTFQPDAHPLDEPVGHYEHGQYDADEHVPYPPVRRQEIQYIIDDSTSQRESHDDDHPEAEVVYPAPLSDELGISRIVSACDDRAYAWSHSQEGDHSAQDIAWPMGEEVTAKGKQCGKAEEDDGYAEGEISGGLDQGGSQVTLPGCSHSPEHGKGSSYAPVMFRQTFGHTIGQEILQPSVGGFRQAYAIWSKKGGEDAYCHYHRIQEGTGDLECLSQSCYDKGKLSYLHQ